VKVRTHIAMNGYSSGAVLDLPDDEAASLIAQNLATAAVDDTAAVIESATIEAPENAAAPKPRARKAPARKAEQ
jgi:hypothetical protein